MRTYYREQLFVPWWWWCVAALLSGSFGIALGYPLGLGVGAATFALTFAAACALLAWIGAMQLVVTDDELRAGNGRLPLGVVGEVRALDPQRTHLLLGPRLDPAAHLAIRGYVATAVQVRVDDPEDPVPYWLVSSRRPQRLAALIEERAAVTR